MHDMNEPMDKEDMLLCAIEMIVKSLKEEEGAEPPEEEEPVKSAPKKSSVMDLIMGKKSKSPEDD